MCSALVVSSEDPLEEQTTGAIVCELRELGAEARLIHPTEACYVADASGLQILDGQGSSLSDVEVVLVRRTRGAVNASLDLIQAFSSIGVRTIERMHCFMNPLSKVESAISRAGKFPIPATWILRDSSSVEVLKDKMILPLLVKPFRGTGGKGIVKVDDEEALMAQLEQHFSEDDAESAPILMQQWVDKVADYRVLVLGDRALATIRRQPEDADATAWNVAQGAETQRVEGREDIAELAVQLAMHESVEIAGVDIIEDEGGGLWVLECNRNPNFTGLQDAYPELNVAKEIAEYVLSCREESA